MEPRASESVKEPMQVEITVKTEVDDTAISNAHNDIKSDLNHLKHEPGLVQSFKGEPAFLVKEEILEDSSQDGFDQQCVQGASTSAHTGRLNEACSTSLSDLLNVKNELAEMDIGPTVLQHMDIHYTIDKQTMNAVTKENSIVDNCNEAVPCGGVKKDSVEDKFRVDKTIPCKYCGQKVIEDDNDAHMKFCQQQTTEGSQLSTLGQQKDLHQHYLRQLHATSSIGSMCNRTITKPHLLSVHNKLHQQNSRKNSMMSSNQWRDETAETKLKPYSSKADKFAPDVLVKQIKVHTDKKSYRCDTCDKIFARNSTLVRHMRVHTGEKPYRCDTCDKRFAHNGNLVTHMRIHAGEKPYRCGTCDARFAQNGNLIKHMRIHTGEKYPRDKRYPCDTCDARFTHKTGLINHGRVHTGEKPFRCDTCDARFAQKSHLTNHGKVHTGEKPYRCDTCDARFVQNCNLVSHMKIHTGEKPYRCDTCDKRFTHNTNLVTHMRIHTGEKPYRCDTCDARFTHNGSLVYHMRIHSGVKPYRCDTCDARFARNGDLVKHITVHTGEKPYRCETCDARFSHNGNLIQHNMRVHTSEKPYGCGRCDKRFARRSFLVQHIRGHMNESIPL